MNKITAFLSALLMTLPALPSLACAVCFGDTDSPMAGAVNMSILFMIVVTYFVIGGGLVAFFVLRFRARRKDLEAADATSIDLVPSNLSPSNLSPSSTG